MAMDMRRSNQGGGKAVTAAIIGWVFAILAVVWAVITFQERDELKQAVAKNMHAFESSVADHFVAKPLPQNRDDPYGLIYSSEAYDRVGKDLAKARKYDGLVDALEWPQSEDLEASIRQYLRTVGKEKGTEFTTLRRLMNYYAAQLETMKQQNQDLMAKFKESEDGRTKQIKEAKDRDDEWSTKVERLRKENQQKFAEYSAELDKLRGLWRKAIDERDQRGKELEKVKQDLNEKIAKEQGKVGQLAKEIAELKRLKASVKKLEPQGTVVRVKKAFNMIYLSGGKDKGYEPNEKFVIYTETPLGERIKKGEVAIKDVYNYTMMGGLVSEDADHPVIPGDLFVDANVWDANMRLRSGEAVASAEGAAQVEVTPEEIAAAKKRLLGASAAIKLTDEQNKQLGNLVAEAIKLKKQGKTESEITEALKSQTQKFLEGLKKKEAEGGLKELK